MRRSKGIPTQARRACTAVAGSDAGERSVDIPMYAAESLHNSTFDVRESNGQSTQGWDEAHINHATCVTRVGLCLGQVSLAVGGSNPPSHKLLTLLDVFNLD